MHEISHSEDDNYLLGLLGPRIKASDVRALDHYLGVFMAHRELNWYEITPKASTIILLMIDA